MCEISNEYKLCTCTNIDPNDRNNIWILTRFIGFNQYEIMGKIMRSTEDFGNGISCNKLINQLNTKNCFDFEYIASENDCLTI